MYTKRTCLQTKASIYKFDLSVCLYPINVKTAEPIGPKFFDQNFKFLKILKIHILVLFYDVHKENMFTINLEDGREAPSKASDIKIACIADKK